jgi:hypothetical protein
MRRVLALCLRKLPRRTIYPTDDAATAAAMHEADVQAGAERELQTDRWELVSETGERFDVSAPIRAYFKALPNGPRTVFLFRKRVPNSPFSCWPATGGGGVGLV